MSLPLGGGAMGAPPVPMGGSAEDQGVKAVRSLSNRATPLDIATTHEKLIRYTENR